MKKILLTAVLIGAMFSVSAYVVCVAAPLLGKNIKGSGHIVTKTLPAPDFDAIDASRAVKVVVSAGASDIRIEADDNLIDLVVAETRGKTLEVTLDKKASNIQNADITVTIPANGGKIRSLKASSASKITSDATLRADRFTIEASSAAKIKAAVEAASCSIDASSASKISAEVKAATCTVNASSASKIALAGSAEDFTADLSSASKLDAEKFTAVNASILGVDAETGSLEVGKSADLLVLNANPLDDLRALEHPALVIAAGHPVWRPAPKRFEDIDALLDEAYA